MAKLPPRWWAKAAIQGTFSHLPKPQVWNGLFQKYVTQTAMITDGYFNEKRDQARCHIENSTKFGSGIVAARVLELGTGWSPLVPVALVLAGADRVISVDNQNLLSTDRVIQTLQHYKTMLSADDAQVAVLDCPDPQSALQKLEHALSKEGKVDGRAMLSLLGIEALVGDARDISLESDSIDLVVSNDVLEHIPPEVLSPILAELNRLASPTSVASHFINLGDHYVSADAAITEFNFLRYSDRQWRWFNNDLQYVNRLRLSEHRRIHSDSGWHIVDEQNVSGSLSDLNSIQLAEQFRTYETDDLLVTQTWMTSQPASL